MNPNHLFLGTHQDNVDDKVVKGRGNCGRGDRHGSSKLRSEDVLAIRADPRLQHEIAKQYDVHTTTICHIKLRKTWKHI